MSHSNFAFETSTNLQDYPQSIMHMEEYVDKIINHNAVNKLWFLEYPNLYTAGISQTKKLTVNNINNIPIYKSNRGGQITYHGPNMRICYLLYNLKNSKIGCDLKKYIFQLEECMINSLKRLNIESFRDQINHGVWVNHNNKIKKIAAIGVRVRKWVAYHGVAVNLDQDLSFYEHIIPCGVNNSKYGVTSINELGCNISLNELDSILYQEFRKIFFI
ncbi:MAG: lipoyl(octanoyl) transferase LipB [Gammaproteobacteria bacterium]|jgi:lipoyl(octanoyl) transferase|nr:lipoyl(octanoyl) transferase LipB [Gammaproteobacteria bacterium]